MEKEAPPLSTGVRILQLNDGKAGMQGLDKEAINKVILEASRGTPYFSFQEKRQASIDTKVNQLREALGKLAHGERKAALHKMDMLGEALEARRDLSRSIVHIDMDAFFAAVETQDNPELKGKPMAVGSSSMLSTSNYEARRFGVRAAMPGFIAKKLCPQLILVPCHYNRYKEVSGKVKAVVRNYDPDLCAASLDEMYLDLTEYVKKEYKRRLHCQICTKGCLSYANSTSQRDSEMRFVNGGMCENRVLHSNEDCKKRKLINDADDSEECSAVDLEVHSHSKKRKHSEILEDLGEDITDYVTEYFGKEQINDVAEDFGKEQTDDVSDNLGKEQIDDVTEDWMTCAKCSLPLSDEERDQLAYEVVDEIRGKIFLATGLTASAGIAPNVMLAKVCSDQNKPNGQFQLRSTTEDVKSFVASLPVKKVSGIGPVQGQILNALGITTCSDLWSQRDTVACLFTPTSVDFYMRVAKGIGSTTVKSEYVRKSIGVEQTFKEIHDRDELHRKCRELSEEAVEDLQMHNMVGKVVVLKLKTTSFETHTRNQSLSCYTADKEVISGVAKRLLDLEMAALAPSPLRLRLMGIRIANLVDEASVASAERHTAKIKDFLKSKPPNSSLHQGPPNSASSSNGESFELVQAARNSELSEEVKDEAPEYRCPVCNVRQRSKNLSDFNSHIDNCLNRSTIKEILSEDTHKTKEKQQHEGKQSTKKTKLIIYNRTEKRIEDYFH